MPTYDHHVGETKIPLIIFILDPNTKEKDNKIIKHK